LQKQVGLSFQNLRDSFPFLLLRFFPDTISSRMVLLFAAFFRPLSSTFADYTRSFNLQWRQETANLRRGSTKRFTGDIYYRYRGIIGRRSVPLCAPMKTIFGTKLLTSLCASSEKQSGDLIPSVALTAWFLRRIKERTSLYQLWRSVRFRENESRCTKIGKLHEMTNRINYDVQKRNQWNWN